MANELFKKRREEIRKRIDAASSDRESMGIGVPYANDPDFAA